MPTGKSDMTSFFRDVALTIILTWVLLVLGCNSGAQNNVVLVIVDTLAAEHMSCYGYHRKTSPDIDSLAEAGIIYTRAQA